MLSARERLRQWIDRSKLQDQEAADLIGVSAGYLSQLLSGTKVPALDTALRIDDLTGISPRSWKLSQLSNSKNDGEVAVGQPRGFARRKGNS